MNIVCDDVDKSSCHSAHTHACTHARTQARTHTHTHKLTEAWFWWEMYPRWQILIRFNDDCWYQFTFWATLYTINRRLSDQSVAPPGGRRPPTESWSERHRTIWSRWLSAPPCVWLGTRTCDILPDTCNSRTQRLPTGLPKRKRIHVLKSRKVRLYPFLGFLYSFPPVQRIIRTFGLLAVKCISSMDCHIRNYISREHHCIKPHGVTIYIGARANICISRIMHLSSVNM